MITRVLGRIWRGKGCRLTGHIELDCDATICFCACHLYEADGRRRT